MKYDSAQHHRLEELTHKLLNTIENSDAFVDPSSTAGELRKVLSFHDWLYYVNSSPIISDQQYDQLFIALKKIEREYPELISADSPTQRVARGLTENFPTVPHLVPMLSLDNSYDKKDLLEWDQRLKKLTNKNAIEYCVEPKFDGSSIALVYENDLLTRAATRGNGIAGDEITNNAKVLRSIPLSAKFSKFGITKAELRGEVVIEKKVFENLNKTRFENDLVIFQNARNTASGALRMKDPSEIARRGLEAIMYQISFASDQNNNSSFESNLTNHYDAIEMLQKLGFKTTLKYQKIYTTIDEVLEYCNEWETKRDAYYYEIDGMVIKVNNVQLQSLAGETAHHPRWAIAFKFKARQAQSTLLKIDYQVGRTGAVTPVAKLRPVALSGVTISSVSLHNEDFIRDKDLRIGDTIIVERAGDVIPYIVGAMKEIRTGTESEVVFPTKCPSCNTDLVKSDNEAVWRCININCPAQQEERLIHFVSKGAMDISGLGKDIIKRFVKAGLINRIPDIFKLDFQAISELEGWKEKSVNNLKNGIEKSKNQPLWRLIVGFGIRHVGSQTAKTLVRHINSLLDIENFTSEELMEFEDIGPTVADSIHDFFQNPDNIAMIQELQTLGVNIIQSKKQSAVANLLDGQTFLFTGTLTKMSRDKAKELTERYGGKILSAVSSNLNYLVAGEKAGSKLAKAKKMSTIRIIDEAAFLKMIGQDASD